MQKENRSGKILIFLIGILWFSVYVYTPILSPYCEGLGINYTVIGTILSSYGLVQLILRIPIGMFSDWMGKRKPIIIFGLFVGLISNVGFYFSTTPILLTLCRAGAGVAASCWAIFMTMYTNYYPADQQGNAIGRSNSMMLFGQVFATFVGGLIAQYFDEKLTFVVAAAVGLIGLLLCSGLEEEESKETKKPSLKQFAGLLKNADLIFYSLCAIIMQLAIYTGAFGFVPNILKDLGASNFMLGLVSSCASLPGIFSSYLSGSFFKEKIGQDNTVMGSYVLLALTLFATVLTKNVVLILIITSFSGFAKGLIQPILTSLAVNKVDKSLRSTAVSFYQSVYSVGMTLGPIFAGYFADNYGMKNSFIIMGCITLTGTLSIAVYKLIRRKHQSA